MDCQFALMDYQFTPMDCQFTPMDCQFTPMDCQFMVIYFCVSLACLISYNEGIKLSQHFIFMKVSVSRIS